MKNVSTIIDYALLVGILAFGVVIVAHPGLVLAPAPRVTLYFILSVAPAYLLAKNVQAQLELKMGPMMAVLGGSFAAFVTLLFVLTHLTKPEVQIAVYNVFAKEDGVEMEVNLEGKDVVQVLRSGSGANVDSYVDGNTLILIFPEQVSEAEVQIRWPVSGPVYTEKLTYAGTRSSRLVLKTRP